MSRRSIQQLNPHLVNRIAAGEVIERPAAVVKELVENAIDAGATSILVEAEDGGRATIRVIDNGGGIPPEELLLAFAQHATSKIRDDDDLFAIATMGFRGEALASIGAVSQARVLSRVPESDAAYEIHNRGGAISDPQAAAGNVGTTVEVRNLFFNTPARRKFIKGAPTEIGNISDILQRIALPHPHVAFKLTHNGRTSMDLPVTTAEERMLSAWPADFRPLRIAVDARDAELHIRGIVGLPELARPTAKYQYLYLNGRHIKDRFIQHAVREAYRGLTEPGRHPAAILMLDVPPGDVDVNVHPTKIEVRFKDGGRIHSLVYSGVRERLLDSDLTPAAVPMRSDAASPQTLPEPVREDMRHKLASFFRDTPATQMLLPETTAPVPPATPLPPMPSSFSSPLQHKGPPLPVPAGQGQSGTWNAERRAEPTDDFSPAAPQVRHSYAADPLPEHPHPGSPSEGEGTGRAAPSSASAFASAAPALQLHNSYLVAESPDGLVIIDQHALHERIMYEDLLTRVRRGPLEAQRLLIPEPVNVSSSQVALLEHVKPLLERLGIEVTEFGPNAVAIHSFPSFLHRLQPTTFVRELLERGEQELLDLHDEELLHEVLDMMACKAAVKAGDPLTAPEIEALLARRDLLERASNCPHGRPTTLRLTLKDLEKQFKRTGF
ncbi:MAG TPA: DNA mismatch repair endonuclease MutL [Tepidisphaeraceae bacterium]|jgi:DNA mismatch repair protein MutL|nr:DNA mismatch repair endonuclease MutL [Tepidisphaeraceae bacterium]